MKDTVWLGIFIFTSVLLWAAVLSALKTGKVIAKAGSRLSARESPILFLVLTCLYGLVASVFLVAALALFFTKLKGWRPL